MFDYQSVSKVSIFLSVELLMLEYFPGLTPSSRMVRSSGTGLLPPRNSCYFLLKKMPQLRALAASPSHQNHQRAASTSKETLADLGSQRRGNVFTVGCFRSPYVDSFHFNRLLARCRRQGWLASPWWCWWLGFASQILLMLDTLWWTNIAMENDHV